MATASTSGAARAEPCWCTRVTVPASLLDDLPADAKGVACLCAACIAGSATGNADTKVGKENDIPDWTVAGWKSKWPESKVIDIGKNGKSGTKMKAFKDKLTEDEIIAVSKYSRTLGK